MTSSPLKVSTMHKFVFPPPQQQRRLLLIVYNAPLLLEYHPSLTFSMREMKLWDSTFKHFGLIKPHTPTSYAITTSYSSPAWSSRLDDDVMPMNILRFHDELEPNKWGISCCPPPSRPPYLDTYTSHRVSTIVGFYHHHLELGPISIFADP